MLKIRSINASDYSQIKAIHDKHYTSEFSLPDFVTNYLGAFVVEEDDKIITVIGLRTIVEAVALTDKDFSPRLRRLALLIGSQALSFIAGKNQYEHLHLFVQDPVWKQQLEKAGFRSSRGDCLIREV